MKLAVCSSTAWHSLAFVPASLAPMAINLPNSGQPRDSWETPGDQWHLDSRFGTIYDLRNVRSALFQKRVRWGAYYTGIRERKSVRGSRSWSFAQ